MEGVRLVRCPPLDVRQDSIAAASGSGIVVVRELTSPPVYDPSASEPFEYVVVLLRAASVAFEGTLDESMSPLVDLGVAAAAVAGDGDDDTVERKSPRALRVQMLLATLMSDGGGGGCGSSGSVSPRARALLGDSGTPAANLEQLYATEFADARQRRVSESLLAALVDADADYVGVVARRPYYTGTPLTYASRVAFRPTALVARVLARGWRLQRRQRLMRLTRSLWRRIDHGLACDARLLCVVPPGLLARRGRTADGLLALAARRGDAEAIGTILHGHVSEDAVHTALTTSSPTTRLFPLGAAVVARAAECVTLIVDFLRSAEYGKITHLGEVCSALSLLLDDPRCDLCSDECDLRIAESLLAYAPRVPSMDARRWLARYAHSARFTELIERFIVYDFDSHPERSGCGHSNMATLLGFVSVNRITRRPSMMPPMLSPSRTSRHCSHSWPHSSTDVERRTPPSGSSARKRVVVKQGCVSSA
jgi:hypothetical protein